MKEKTRSTLISISGFLLGLGVAFLVAYPYFENYRVQQEHEKTQKENRLKKIETRLDGLEKSCSTRPTKASESD